MQDYGGPVGFRIIGRNRQALDWVIIQNTNAYENGFTPAWDAFRKALWVNRSAATEAPLAAFNTHDGIKGVHQAGSAHPELISPDSWESDEGFMRKPNGAWQPDVLPYSTLPIFFTAAIRRAPSSTTNFENSGASM